MQNTAIIPDNGMVFDKSGRKEPVVFDKRPTTGGMVFDRRTMPDHHTRCRRIQSATANHIETRNAAINLNIKMRMHIKEGPSLANESNLVEEYIKAQQSVVISPEKNTA